MGHSCHEPIEPSEDLDQLEVFLTQTSDNQPTAEEPPLSVPALPPLPDATAALESEDDAEQALWEMTAPRPVTGPRVYCVPLTQSALAPYTPRDSRRGIETARELLTRGPYSFADIVAAKLQDCPGVYALYYQGDLEMYRLLRDETSSLPIYIGGADNVLGRLRQHNISLTQASNLDPSEFSVRIVPLPRESHGECESRVLRLYEPLWNDTLKGFGSRGYAKDARARRKARWDVAHPNRIGAGPEPKREDVAAIIESAIPDCLAAYHWVAKLLALDEQLTEADQ